MAKSSSQVVVVRNGTKQDREWRDSAFLALGRPHLVESSIEWESGKCGTENWKNSLDRDGDRDGDHYRQAGRARQDKGGGFLSCLIQFINFFIYHHFLSL